MYDKPIKATFMGYEYHLSWYQGPEARRLLRYVPRKLKTVIASFSFELDAFLFLTFERGAIELFNNCSHYYVVNYSTHNI